MMEMPAGVSVLLKNANGLTLVARVHLLILVQAGNATTKTMKFTILLNKSRLFKICRGDIQITFAMMTKVKMLVAPKTCVVVV